MKTQITSFKELYIPKPCHEDWDKMTATEQGRFCDSCRHVVYDFSDKTVEEFNLINKNNSSYFCGRFSEDQINQDYKYIAGFKRNPVVTRLKRVASFLITFITLKIATIREGFSQAALKDSLKTEVVSYDSDYRRMGGAAEIQGQVRKKKNKEHGIPCVSVNLYDPKGNLVTSTTTEVNGYFYLTIPNHIQLDQFFSIVAEKERSKTRSRITRYSRVKKKITPKEFGSVVISMGVHSRWRRNLLLRKPRVMLTGRYLHVD